MDMRGLPTLYYVSGGQINDIYQDLFGRDADPEGLAFYENLLSGASLSDAASVIAGGARGSDVQELADGIGDTTGGQFNTVADYVVDTAYGDVLNRDVDPEGYNFYTQAIQSGSMDPTTLDEQLARSREAISTLGADKAQQAWEDATAFQNWNQMRIDYPEVYPLYAELRGPTGYVSPEELQLYGRAFGPEVSPQERETFFRGALSSGEITQEQLDRIIGGENPQDVIGSGGGARPPGTMPIAKPGDVVRTPDGITMPATGIMGLPAISMPQFLPEGGLSTRATKPYDAGATLQGPTGLFRPVTVGAPPTLMAPVTVGAAPTAEGMKEGGMAKATPAELGSKFNISEFVDEQGRLISGYSRPIRDEFGTILGYEDRPYERNVVFNPRLREREEEARAKLAQGGLASAAQNLARRGRGGDSMLVHMAPEEVSGLRALARAQGNDLTINPNTGLPEAFSLKKLFKAASFILPFVPIPGLFGMSSLLTRSILSGVAAGASAKGKFDFKQALGGGLRAYALGSLGEKMSGAATPGGTPTTPQVTAPEAASVNVMGDVTGVPGEIPSPSELAQFQNPAPLQAPISRVDAGFANVGAPGTIVQPGQAPITSSVEVSPGNLPMGTETVPGRMSSVITPEGQGYGKALTSGTEIAMAGLGGLSIEEGAKEARNYELQAAAARREDEERQRRFNELFGRTLGRVPVRSGGQINLAKGGMTYMEAGGTTDVTGEPRVVRGTGDGMSDSVPATIEGVQEARLANDEFVIPADVVADIGNGSSDAGAKKLYDMMDRIRKARHGTTKQPPEIKAERLMPA